jgi:hypothetical protein
MAVIGQRYKDVLFALAATRQYDADLGRLQLQKYIYLGDVLTVLWGILAPRQSHQTYRNGPYDQGIQNAVDVLAFRGFVTVVQSRFRIDGAVYSSYRISELGLELSGALVREGCFARKLHLYECIGSHVNELGWDRLRDLVYSEVTYLTKRGEAFGQYLQNNSLLTNESLRIVFGFNTLLEDESARLSRDNLTALFFQFLDNYQSVRQQQNDR